MRVAIVGGGISGLATAWFAKDCADVVLYERDAVLGGHARSIPVESDGATVHAESGFKYIYESTHPNVLALLRLLGIETRRVPVSMTVAFADGSFAALPPRSLGNAIALFRDSRARRGAAALFRLTRPNAIVRNRDWSEHLESYLLRTFATDVCHEFLLPFFSGSWGMPVETMARFPAYDVLKVLCVGHSPSHEIVGGTSRYITALVGALDGVDLRVNTPVRAVRRDGGALVVESETDAERFDHVVLASAAHHASRLVEDASLAQLLARFGYCDTEVAIHTDASFMPPNRRDWASLHYVFEPNGRVFLTEWCGWHARRDVFRTWLLPGRTPPRGVRERFAFQHLVVTPDSLALQRQLATHQGQGGLWFAGMYVTDVDTHESSLVSALDVARKLVPNSRNLRALQEG
jgi:predicted NAD/FAD-binding protein